MESVLIVIGAVAVVTALGGLAMATITLEERVRELEEAKWEADIERIRNGEE